MVSASKKVVIVGIPGVGKTTVVTKLGQMLKDANIETAYVVFGTVMFEAAQKMGVKSRDDMRKLDVKTQKQLQINAASAIAKKTAPIVLVDTHLFISTKEGYMPGLPNDILKALSPTNLILVEANPNDIISRRQNDPTRVRDIIERGTIEMELLIAKSMLSASAVIAGAAIKMVTNAEGKPDECANEIFEAIR
ncbi:MAG: adenylate kinase [Thaumarchaeota archaeon]|nr:adenylate kinase [Nitrososphaerota archaeon]